MLRAVCRHVLSPGETLSSLAVKASQAALEMAGLSADQIDLVLFCTSSPDDLFGAACQVWMTSVWACLRTAGQSAACSSLSAASIC